MLYGCLGEKKQYSKLWQCLESLFPKFGKFATKYYLILFVIAFFYILAHFIYFYFILFFGFVASGIFVPCESCSVMSDPVWPRRRYSPQNSPGQNTGVGSLSLLQGVFSTQGSSPGLPHCRQILYQLSHQGSPRTLVRVAYSFSSSSFWPRNWTRVSCITGELLPTGPSGKPWPGMESAPLQLKCRVLTTGLVGKSDSWLLNMSTYSTWVSKPVNKHPRPSRSKRRQPLVYSG